jgi:hypothetical protein
MELSRIDLIRQSDIKDLENRNYMEDLILKLGLNTEESHEQPDIV